MNTTKPMILGDFQEKQKFGGYRMYTVKNYRTKKAMITDLKNGVRIEVYQPGPFGPDVMTDGPGAIAGPHYPEPHRWYASCVVKDGVVIKAK
jgi:hypothetical protein